MTNFENQVRLLYTIPSRGLIGFSTDFMTLTKGYGIMNHAYKEYRKMASGNVGERKLGVMVSMENGKALGYSLFNLQDRGTLIIEPSTDVYCGMIVGIHNRDNDLDVNPCKNKNLTNTRSSGADEAIVLTKAKIFNLEEALEFIEDDEYVEVTPDDIRLRKKYLDPKDRFRNNRNNNE